MKHLSTTILIAALVLLPLAAIAEHTDLKTWNERLIWPQFEPEPDRHTPQHTDGTILPPTISGNLVLTPENNPVLLTTTTQIERGASVTITPGTTVAAHEFATLSVAGRLAMTGTETQPVTLETNELHPENQVWNGIIVEAGGVVTATHTRVRHASPALTCLPQAQATLTNVEIEANTLAMFTASPGCSIRNSTIRSTRDGVVAIDIEPHISNTKFFVGRNEITTITNQ